MEHSTPDSVAQRIIDGLREFAEKLEAGIPIEGRRMIRVDTPDGPMHCEVPIVIQPKSDP